jgi:hypothetical protein
MLDQCQVGVLSEPMLRELFDQFVDVTGEGAAEAQAESAN